MVKDINKEIEKLIMLKAEVDEIETLKNSGQKVEVVSQLMYDFLSGKGLLKQDTLYRITSHDVGQYVEGFRG